MQRQWNGTEYDHVVVHILDIDEESDNWRGERTTSRLDAYLLKGCLGRGELLGRLG